MKTLRIAVLGAGPAGLALAARLLQRTSSNIELHLIEQSEAVGGLAASFEHRGIYFDYGSHRLHPAANTVILEDVQRLLGSDLLLRPRRGRIRLSGRFVGYPLKLFDLARHLPPSFLTGIGCDMLTMPLRRRRDDGSYADILLKGLGRTLSESFYFPFARKLWGLEPTEIAADQARRRVSASSLAQVMRRITAATFVSRGPGAGKSYYYPRQGFGQLCGALADVVRQAQGVIHLGTKVKALHRSGNLISAIEIAPTAQDTARQEIPVDFVFSTIPLLDLLTTLQPTPPAEILEAAQGLRYRAIVFCYLILGISQFTPFDAHYFPEEELVFSRVSEPKNYTGTQEPEGITGLCAEIPCWTSDVIWQAPAEELGRLVCAHLAKAGLPPAAPVEEVLIRRQAHAYPVYDLGFAPRFQKVQDWLGQATNLVTLGRQGLHAHNNIHHSLEMAYAACECLRADGTWDTSQWQAWQQRFQEQVVID